MADTASVMAKTRKGLSQRSPSSTLTRTYLPSNEARKEDLGLKREPAAGILHRRRRRAAQTPLRIDRMLSAGWIVVEVGKAESAPSPRMCVIVQCPSETKSNGLCRSETPAEIEWPVLAFGRHRNDEAGGDGGTGLRTQKYCGIMPSHRPAQLSRFGCSGCQGTH